MSDRHKLQQSGLEFASQAYCFWSYRDRDWFATGSVYFWLTLVAALVVLWRGFETVHLIFQPARDHSQELAVAMFLAPYFFFLWLHSKLKDVASDRALERINSYCSARFSNVYAARSALLSRLFHVAANEFVEIACSLDQLLRLKSVVGSAESGPWIRSLRAIYDPNSKPRIIAFFALLVAVIVASTRSMQFDGQEIFEVWEIFQSLTLGMIFLITIFLWIITMVGIYAIYLLEWLARALDRRVSSSFSARRTIGDLIQLSRLG